MKAIFTLVPSLVESVQDVRYEDIPSKLISNLNKNIENFSEEIQKAYNAFSSQEFLACPHVNTEFHQDVRLFKWEDSNIIRNAGSRFQLYSVATVVLYFQYVLNGRKGFKNTSISYGEEGIPQLENEFSEALALVKSIICLAE